ncbi:hypothetical protein FNF27_07132 [Cafeteria roenbergensis]|uniref:Heparan-alpha-glucosaminide N-acetyltransferase catalytic domain-containing protein n=2 Tax=Cafeteria roenbergensis TaxID=33653 RepID=A0A5A8DXV8_CAFRO|nr:hypothetical protein FNF27_07132 [Cafeteria roenbergensis]
MSRAALWVLAAAGLALSSSAFKLRMVNGLETKVSIVLMPSKQSIASAAPLSVGPTTPMSQLPGNSSGWDFQVQAQGYSAVGIPELASFGEQNTTMGTVVVYLDELTASMTASVIWDLNQSWPSDGIDRARVRFISAVPAVVQTRTVTADCVDCLKPVQTPYLAPAAPSAEWPLPSGSALPGAKLPPFPGYAVFRTAFALELDVVWPNISAGFLMPGAVSMPSPPVLCNSTLDVAEHSVVTAFILPLPRNASTNGTNASTVCNIVWAVDVEGDSTWIPLVVGMASTFGAGVGIWVAIWVADHYCIKREDEDDGMRGGREYITPAGRDLRTAARASAAPSQRVHAIDIWRGTCLLIMVFVNYGGGGYWWLDHSAWNGLTVADIVFACFVFTMGASMALSLRSQRKKGATRCAMSGRMAWRAAKLLAVGLFLNTNGGSTLNQWRLPGVLQYFAVAALVVSLIDIWMPKVAMTTFSSGGDGGAAAGGSVNAGGSAYGGSDYAALSPHGDSMGMHSDAAAARAAFGGGSGSGGSCCGACLSFSCGDVTPYLLEWLLILGLEAVYLCIQFLMPVPGCPTGYLGPGGLADQGKYWNCPGGAHGYIDRLIFGVNHMYHNVAPTGEIVSAATCADTFRCNTYDPEGTLGAINAVVIAYLGLQAGRILLAHKTAPAKGHSDPTEGCCCSAARGGLSGVALRWLMWAVVCGLIAGGLCAFSKDGGPIPVTKNLWSTSYILGMAGASFFALALLLSIIDTGLVPWDGAPAVGLGTNSIAVYCISEVFQMYIPFTIVWRENTTFELSQDFRSHTEAVIANFVGVTMISLIAIWMRRNKIFIKL